MPDTIPCRKCSAELPSADFAFCPFCGAKQAVTSNRKQRSKARGNGQGTAIRRGNTWTAIVTVGWKKNPDPSKPKIPVRRSKGGFATKKEAIAYCPELQIKNTDRRRLTLEETYEEWSDMYSPRVGQSTMDGYKYAYKHFSRLHGIYMDMISPEDLQRCMDECKSGHRTHQNMKCVAGLLWGYAFDHNIVEKNITKNLFIGKGKSVQREPITADEVKAIRDAIGTHRYADYIYCLCYLGFRPGEMLELKKDMLHCAMLPNDETGEETPVWYFVNGKKTEAGRNRIVIVPGNILEIVLSRLFIPGTDLMFPQYQFTVQHKQPSFRFKQMSHGYFNQSVFKPLMEKLGFSGNKVPYCARHTYADLLKNAAGSDRDKARLIGHASYNFTQSKYQSTDLQDLKSVVDSFR